VCVSEHSEARRRADERASERKERVQHVLPFYRLRVMDESGLNCL